MPVNIKIDLKTGKAHTKINLLKAHLTQLENVTDDFDFEVNIGDAASEIQNLISALEDVEMKVNNISDDLARAAQELDGTTIGIDTPDGGTGTGDGGGTDPPRSVTVRHDLADILNEGAADGGTSGMDIKEFNRKMDSIFGTRSGVNTLPGMQQQLPGGAFRDPETGRFKEARRDLFRDPRFIGQRTEFGMESQRMARLRVSELTPDELDSVRNIDIGGGFDMFDGGSDPIKNLRKRFDGLELESINRGFSRFGDSLKRFTPTMRKWWQLLALIIPLLIAFGAQALGVAAAMGAVAVAGAGILGLGLVGHADDMGDAFEQAKVQVQDFKAALFETFQPAARQFAPIQAEFFDFAPAQLTDVSDALEGLTAYEDVIFSAFKGGAEWVEQFIDLLVENEDTVTQLATRFGGILGNEVLKFFSFLLREASENQQMLIDLGAVLVHIATIIYNVSMAVGKMVGALRPLFEFLSFLSGILHNDVILALISFIAFAGLTTYFIGKLTLGVWGLIGALAIVYDMLALLGGGSLLAGISAFFLTLYDYIIATILALYEMSAAAGIAAAALAATGIGAIVVAGGMGAAAVMSQSRGPPSRGPGGRPPGPRGGSSVTYNYNTYEVTHTGEMSTDSEQRLRSSLGEGGGAPSPATGAQSSSAGEDMN